jgi:hypothetical protein
MTIYLCLSAMRMATCNRWFRLFINLALAAFEQEPIKPYPPVLMVLDEFATLGHMSTIENAAGQIAGFGVKLWPILQDRLFFDVGIQALSAGRRVTRRTAACAPGYAVALRARAPAASIPSAAAMVSPTVALSASSGCAAKRNKHGIGRRGSEAAGAAEQTLANVLQRNGCGIVGAGAS